MIFAIDPGTKVSTAVLYNPEAERVVEVLRDISNTALRIQVREHAHTGHPIVIEDFENYGAATPIGYDCATMLKWAGRFWEIADRHGSEPHWVKRTAIKLHLCGSRRAKDKDVRAAIVERFGGEKAAKGRKANPGPLYGVASHAWSALAVALTWGDIHGEGENHAGP